MFQDTGIGILLAILTSYLFDVPISPWLVIACIVFSLLPDLDFLLPAKMVRGHRGIMHYPFIYLVISILVYFIFGPLWSFIFISGVFLHLIHDTVFLGWGIKWSWPYSLRAYKFFPDKDGRITSKFFLSWMPEEEAKVKSEYGSDEEWMRTFFGTVNIVSVIEYSIFTISLIMLYFYTR